MSYSDVKQMCLVVDAAFMLISSTLHAFAGISLRQTSTEHSLVEDRKFL